MHRIADAIHDGRSCPITPDTIATTGKHAGQNAGIEHGQLESAAATDGSQVHHVVYGRCLNATLCPFKSELKYGEIGTANVYFERSRLRSDAVHKSGGIARIEACDVSGAGSESNIHPIAGSTSYVVSSRGRREN